VERAGQERIDSLVIVTNCRGRKWKRAENWFIQSLFKDQQAVHNLHHSGGPPSKAAHRETILNSTYISGEVSFK
jgi:hypothetical protein